MYLSLAHVAMFFHLKTILSMKLLTTLSKIFATSLTKMDQEREAFIKLKRRLIRVD